MRYRAEELGPEKDHTIAIRNVETDLVLGLVLPHSKDELTDVLTLGGTIATFENKMGVLEHATHAVARYEEHYGYPDLRDCRPNPQPDRIERRLGTIMADAVCCFSQALVDKVNGVTNDLVKKKFGELVAELFPIYSVSQTGSLNGENRQIEPYFASVPVYYNRLHFSDAALMHGLFELQTRVRHADEGASKVLLLEVLKIFDEAVKSLPPLANSRTQSNLVFAPHPMTSFRPVEGFKQEW